MPDKKKKIFILKAKDRLNVVFAQNHSQRQVVSENMSESFIH